MNNFGDDSRREAVVPFRLLVVKHIFAQHSRENTGKNCGNTAGKASIFAGTPKNGKPTLDTADYACYDSCWSTEEKPCADRRGIAGIYDCAVDFTPNSVPMIASAPNMIPISTCLAIYGILRAAFVRSAR